jgi:positive regulator of sigma E activity
MAKSEHDFIGKSRKLACSSCKPPIRCGCAALFALSGETIKSFSPGRMA